MQQKRPEQEGERSSRFTIESRLRGSVIRLQHPSNRTGYPQCCYIANVKLMRVTIAAKIAAGMTPIQMLPYLRNR